MKIVRSAILFTGIGLLLYFLLFFINVNIRVKKYPLLLSSSDIYSVKGGPTYQTFQEFDVTGSYDVLIIGSSHAYRGYDPRNFQERGIKAFNLGTSAQSIVNTYFLIDHYVNSANCRLLIFDVYEGTFMNEGFESTSNLIENVSSDRAALDIAWGSRDIRAINLITYRFFSRNHEPVFLDSTYVGYGFCERADSVKPGFKFQPGKFVVNTKQLQYFEKALQLLNDKKIPFVVVSHPMPSKGGYINHDVFSNTVKLIVEKYHGRFFDFTNDSSFEARNHFSDQTHLNQAGVKLFNKKLLDTLMEHKIVPKPD